MAVAAPESAPERDRALPYLPGLDGLRGLAVAGVLLFHGGIALVGGGFLGVSLFFTLSGFLITSLLLREADRTGGIAFGAFWNRRFRRLLPAALLAILLSLAFTVLAASPAQRAGFRADALAALGYAANWRFVAAGESYGALFAAPSPLLHFWSLAIEEQFYLLFPLLAWAVLRLGRGSHRVAGAVFGVLFAVSAALPRLTGWSDDRIYFGTDTRAAELLAGALLAVLLARRRLDRPLGPGATAALRWLGPVDLVVLIAIWVSTGQADRWLYEGGLAVYAALSALVVLAALDARNPVARLLAVTPLRELGRISYGVYLYHWPIFLWLSPARTGWPTGVAFLVAATLTIGIAVASFHLVEQPVRARRGWGGRIRVVAVAPAAIGAVVVLVLLATSTAPPVPTEAALAPGQLLSGVGAGPAPTVAGDRATPPATPLPAPAVRPPDRPLQVLVVGDSTAAWITPGINDWGLRHDIWGAANYARIGCGLGRGGQTDRRGKRFDVPDDCNHWDTDWPKAIADNKPDLIVVADGFWDATDRLLPGDDTWRHPGDPVYDDFLRREWSEAADVLLTAGVPVLWLDNPPIRLGLDDVPPDPEQFAVNDPARMERLNELLAEVAATRPGLRIIPWRSYVLAWPDGPFATNLRPDGMHLDETSSRVVAEWLAPTLLDAYWSLQGGPPAGGTSPPGPTGPAG